jgi:redox-sensitive bicupin YhaK (pirin superfamily)
VLHQDVKLFASIIPAGEQVEHTMDQQRYAWIQVARGAVSVNGEKADQGDGVMVAGESNLQIKAEENAEVLLFDLA